MTTNAATLMRPHGGPALDPESARLTVIGMLTIAVLFEVSVARAWMVCAPSPRVTVADHVVVPAARIQVDPSTLTSTFRTAALSEAVPWTVMVTDVTVAPDAGDVIAIEGFVVSGNGVGIAETSADRVPSPAAFTAAIS